MVVLGAIFEAPDLHALTKSGWAAMLYMASVPMGICYLSWFAALRKLRPIEAAGVALIACLAFQPPSGGRETNTNIRSSRCERRSELVQVGFKTRAQSAVML